jgi:uncharacterized protein (TIGR03118 family)
MSRLTSTARILTAFTAAAGSLTLAGPAMADSHHDDHRALAVTQVNLVSDIPGKAAIVDPDLVNPWGLALGATSPLWSANAGTDTSTVYSSAPGSTTATKAPIRVTLPGSPALPTGQVANGGTGFVLSNGTTSAPARFIFSTITGRIEAWAPGVDPAMGAAEVKATVPGSVYTGLALATATTGDRLYAADFGQGEIDVFDSTFTPVTLPSWAFRDRHLPKGFAPFGVQKLGNDVFVTYAKPDPATGKSAAGKGLGFVDEYTTDGRLVSRVASRQSLNAPWGLAIAPSTWGDLAGSLLVGDFGDGRINVIRKKSDGRYDDKIEGQVTDGSTGKPLSIPGLWSLLPGTATAGGTDSIWFSAGIDNEQHGLIGVLRKS